MRHLHVFAILFSFLILSTAAPAQFSGTTALPGDMAPAVAIGSQQEFDIAPGNGSYLAVWQDDLPNEGGVEFDPWDLGQHDIVAHRLAPDGIPLEVEPILVTQEAFSQKVPRAAWNGTDWLVVFESRSLSSTGMFTTQDVVAVRVSGQGQVLDATPIPLDVDDDEEYTPAVASDGANWLVVWTDAFEVFGALVNPSGQVVSTKVLASTGWAFDLAVAYAGGRYLITWQGTSGSKGMLVGAMMNVIKAPFTVATQGVDPDVATDGTDFYVTTRVGGSWPIVKGTLVTNSGAVQSPVGVTLDNLSYLSLDRSTVAWDGTQYMVAWQEWSVWDDEIKFNSIDAAGNVLLGTPGTVLSTQAFSFGELDLGSLGQGDSFLAWRDNRIGGRGAWDGFGAVIDAAGGVGPQAAFTTAPPAQLDPDLATGPVGATPADDVHLAVFVSADAADTRIVYQRLDGEGNALDSEPVVVASGSQHLQAPAAAWNGNVWLVVWEEFLGTSYDNGDVYGMRIDASGALLDPAPFPVMDGNVPQVAALGGDFLVVSSHEPVNHQRYIYGMRVRGSDGALLDGSPVLLGGNYAVAPAVAAFSDRWGVVWARHLTHDDPNSQLQMNLVLPNGENLGVVSPNATTWRDRFPDLAVHNDVGHLVWGDGSDIRVRQVLPSGAGVGPAGGTLVSGAPEEQEQPSIAWDGAKFSIAWVDDRVQDVLEPGLGDLYGSRLDTSFNVLDPFGVALAAAFPRPEAHAALGGARGITLATLPELLDSHGTWRVTAGTWWDWQDLGNGLGGGPGVPHLHAQGVLTTGSPFELVVTGALPNSVGFHIVGTTALFAPFAGGTLVPAPDAMLKFRTDATGARSLTGTLPVSLPSGTPIYVQSWILDPGGPGQFSATRALVSVTP